MIVAIVGSRAFNDFDYMMKSIQGEIRIVDIDKIISGGAKGADKLAEKVADFFDIPIKIFHAEWDKYGKSAGYKRNILIVNEVDIVIAFWDGKSKGTQHTMKLAEENKKGIICFTSWSSK